MLAWTRSSPTHICGCALAARAAAPASAAYPAAARYAIRDAEVAPAATEPAESGVGLGVSVGSELPVGGAVVGGGVVGGGVVGGGVVGGVLDGGVLDPVLGGGVRGGGVEPFPGDFVGGLDAGDFFGGLDECCVGVPRAGRFSTLHCRLVAG
jgi:hypothetical protein